MYQKHLIFGLLIVLVFSCGKEENFIDPALQPYIERFLEEANKRGHTFSLDDVQAFLLPQVADEGIRICGLGYAPKFGDKVRRIDIDQLCWEFSNDAEREILVFHELGHALLDRTHNDWKLPNGRNRSIMFAGEFCDIYASYQDCQLELRDYYIDELFNEGILIPEWSKRQKIDRVFFTDDFSLGRLGWTSSTPSPTASTQLDTTQFFSPPAALQLSQTSSQKMTHTWSRTIALFPIKICSNITISTNIKTQSLGDGQLDILISYPSSNGEGITATCEHQFTVEETVATQKDFQNFEFTLRCVPGGKKDIEVQFALTTSQKSAVYLDDISMRLWD